MDNMKKNRLKELLAQQNNCRNFRYLKTEDGKNIRPDIIRSNILSKEEQTSPLISESVKSIIDLRIIDEGGGEQSDTFSSAKMYHLPILFGNLDPHKIGEWLMMGQPEKINDFLEEGYRDFTSSFKSEVQQFFSILLDDNNLPIVFHCSAGKDRTGSLAALLLLALGVSKHDVIQDYMETNNRIEVDKTASLILEHFKSSPEIKLPHPEESLVALKMLLGVKQNWIEMFLCGIESNFGSITNYLVDELQIDVDKLKQIYLT